jgi:hypothetical protein
VDFEFGSLWGGWCSNESASSYGVGVWKNIRRGWGSFSNHTTFDVGDGVNVKFWHCMCTRCFSIGPRGVFW